MIEKRRIRIRESRNYWLPYTIEAWCLGDFNCHLRINDYRCYTVGHTPSGCSISEYTSFPVAIRFMRECHNRFTDDMNRLAEYIENSDWILPDSEKELARAIKLRSLHTCFVPRKSDIEKIRQYAPWWFEMKHSDIVLGD